MPEVFYTPQADEDLIEIWLYIARDNETAASYLVQRLKAACTRLAQMPKLGRARPDIAPELRYLVVGAYVVLYSATAHKVEIVRIVHGARNLPNLT